MTRYFRAVDATDGARMCAAFTSELRRHVARLQQTSCASALEAEARKLPESLNGYRIGAIGIENGTRATVSLAGIAGKDRMRLVRAGTSWRIASAPGLGV